MGNIETLKGILFDTADAIREKTGKSALIDLPDFPDEVRSIETGGGDAPNPDDPLLLVDWDGTLLYSYTYEDAQQISEFPDAPTHEGLTFQGWNWSEVIAKTWLQNHRGAQLKVGATYTPTDGQNHIYWRSPRLTYNNQMYKQNIATTSVNTNAFYNNYCLTNVSLPVGVLSIGTTAFYNCFSLLAINLPRGATRIGEYAFESCYSLISASLPDSLTSIGQGAFYNCYALKLISLPNGVTDLAAYTFYHCHSLVLVGLPINLESIGNHAFQECYSLALIVLPNSLTEISDYAFSDCRSMYKIDIPASVTLIGSYAFNSCYSLADVVIRGTPALGGSSVFSGNPSNQRIYVHRSDLAWFETATNWSAIYGEGKIVAAADHIEYLQSIGIDTTDFEGE